MIYLCQSILKVNVNIEKAELKPPKWCSLLGRVETLSMAEPPVVGPSVYQDNGCYAQVR